jgi:hypothetical protein
MESKTAELISVGSMVSWERSLMVQSIPQYTTQWSDCHGWEEEFPPWPSDFLTVDIGPRNIVQKEDEKDDEEEAEENGYCGIGLEPKDSVGQTHNEQLEPRWWNILREWEIAWSITMHFPRRSPVYRTRSGCIKSHLSRVELGGGGTVGKTLSTGVDSLVTELFPWYVSSGLSAFRIW